MLKFCKYCTKEFDTNRKNKIFCGRRCKGKYFDKNKEKQKLYKRNQAINKGYQTCQYCKSQFLNSENRKFCSIPCSNFSKNKLDYSDCNSQKEKRAKYYRYYYSQNANKIKHKKRVKKTKKHTRKRFNKLKSTLKCSKCEEDHSATLDFHHIDRNNKTDSVSSLVGKGADWQIIIAEIEKCIVLCSNCHRKFHYEENLNSGEQECQLETLLMA